MTKTLILGNLIRQRRTELEYSLRKLSFISGVDHTYISRIERGLFNGTENILDRLSSALDIDRDVLYVSAGRWPPSIQRTEEVIETLKLLGYSL